MRSRYTFAHPDGIHFLTATVVDWIPVFATRESSQILVDALKFCRTNKGLRLYAYVLMENHLHLVAEAPELSRVIQSFKRHTAKMILEWAEATKRTQLLLQFERCRKSHKRASDHQVWQEGVHPQEIRDRSMLEQKIAYVHNNPVRRGYVDAPEYWRLSSARNYLLDDHSVIEIDPLPG